MRRGEVLKEDELIHNANITTTTQSHDIVIVGGGVAGLATALALHRIGLTSFVLERADSLRTAGAALILWVNAWRALDALGVADTLRINYSELQGIEGRSNCSGLKKDVQLIKEGKGVRLCRNLESRCIGRSALLETLAKELPQGTIRFNSKTVSIYKPTHSPFTTVELADGTAIRAKIVIGCDGVQSVVADWLGLQPAKSSGRAAIRGMATYPHAHHLDKKMFQIWSKSLRAGFIPCTDNSVYWFTTQELQPPDAEISRDPESIRRKAMGLVRDLPEPIADIIKRSSAETLNLMTLKWRMLWPSEWGKLYKGSVTVLGDAMHPMTPDLGQGACSTLEDAVVLGRCVGEAVLKLDEWGEEEERKVEMCFRKYVEERRWRVSWIIGAGYITGIVQEGSSLFLRFLRDKIIFPIISMSYLVYCSDYHCGTLPLRLHSRSHVKNDDTN